MNNLQFGLEKINLKLFFLFIFLILLIFQWNAFFSYFSQDDFFHLRVVMGKSFEDIPSFFLSLQEEYAFYRPLSRETFNLIMFKIFGFNPLYYHAFNFILIFTNAILSYLLVRKISKSRIIAMVTVLIYAFSVIHSIELYYLASVQTLFATCFILLSIIFYLTFKRLLSLLFFIMALLSHETAIVLPGILLMVEFFLWSKADFKKFITSSAKCILPFALTGLIYMLNTSLLSNLPDQQVYRPIFSPKSILNTLSWYILWSFGLSEILVDFIGPKFAVNPNLIKWYGQYLKIVIPLFIFLVVSLGILFFRVKRADVKTLFFYIFSYLAAISPFLFFPQHKSSYYLSFATIWFSAILGMVFALSIKRKINRVWMILLVFAFMIISYQTISLNKLTYWAAKRGNAAYTLVSNIQKSYPTAPKGAVFYFKNDPKYPFIAKEWGSSSKQAFYILSGSDALKLLYKDPAIKVYFEDMGPLPEDINKSQVIYYTARFPY